MQRVLRDPELIEDGSVSKNTWQADIFLQFL